jgi:hypothetical protein
MPKTYEVCNHCGKKGVYEIHGWTTHPPGTQECRYCHRVNPNKEGTTAVADTPDVSRENIAELRAEVQRCQEALAVAEKNLYQAEIAPAKYKKGDVVTARRQLPGRSRKISWTGQICDVYPNSLQKGMHYGIFWLLKSGEWSESFSVAEDEIEGLVENCD